MSPSKLAEPTSTTASTAVRSFFALLGARLNEARREKRWTVKRLADEACVSRGLAYIALRGESVSMEAAMRIVGALGLKFDWELVDPRKRARTLRQQDLVHSAMGEYEAAHLRPLRFQISIDEPYQHYQFAGRADLVAWNLDAAAMLHLENRTRFPDLQEAAGAYNAKRAYLGDALAKRLGLKRWRSETHVIVALWSAEVLHQLRLRTESFRALCPDEPSTFEQWWSGVPPRQRKTSTLVVLDPLAEGRQKAFVSLDEALTVRPHYPGYAAVAGRLAA